MTAQNHKGGNQPRSSSNEGSQSKNAPNTGTDASKKTQSRSTPTPNKSGEAQKKGEQRTDATTNPSKSSAPDSQSRPAGQRDNDKSQTNQPSRNDDAKKGGMGQSKERQGSSTSQTNSGEGDIEYGDNEPNDPRETKIVADKDQPKKGDAPRSSSSGRTGSAGAN